MEPSHITRDFIDKCQKQFSKNYELIRAAFQKKLLNSLNFKYLMQASSRFDFGEAHKTLGIKGTLTTTDHDLKNLDSRSYYLLLSFLAIYETEISFSHFSFVNFFKK